jgi:hypothetical protein
MTCLDVLYWNLEEFSFVLFEDLLKLAHSYIP